MARRLATEPSRESGNGKSKERGPDKVPESRQGGYLADRVPRRLSAPAEVLGCGHRAGEAGGLIDEQFAHDAFGDLRPVRVRVPQKPLQSRTKYDKSADDGRRRYTVAEIGETFGVSRATVYRHLEAAGSPDRPSTAS